MAPVSLQNGVLELVVVSYDGYPNIKNQFGPKLGKKKCLIHRKWSFKFGYSTRILTQVRKGLRFKKKRKKYRKGEYVQRRVCFVNVQVPCPHSIIYVKLYTSRLCTKMLFFLFVCAWAMLHILYLSCRVLFPVMTPYNISCLNT